MRSTVAAIAPGDHAYGWCSGHSVAFEAGPAARRCRSGASTATPIMAATPEIGDVSFPPWSPPPALTGCADNLMRKITIVRQVEVGQAMSDLVRFETEQGAALLVEVEENTFGVERVARTDRGILQASQRLEEAFAAARPAIEAVAKAVRRLAPAEHEIEFGITLNAETGVILAKTAVEGHFTVKLKWTGTTTAGNEP